MFAKDLGGGAELRPLEPWQAAEFLTHLDRARESVDPWIPWATHSTDLAGATATLQRYAVCEIGCWLEPAGTGRGLVTRAVRALIDWAFGVRGMHRIEWHCRPDNTASAAVARRVGMRLEGTLRAHFPYRGVRHDTQVWALLAGDG